MEAAVVQFLAPFLPALLHGAGELAESVAGGAIDAVSERARKLWERLWPSLQNRPGGTEAANDVAKAPDDPDMQAALRVHLRKLFEADPALAADVKAMLENRGTSTASADHGGVAVAGGQRASGGGVNVGGGNTGTISTGRPTDD